jgi:hypothetical protein
MHRSWLMCVLLGSLAWGQAAPSSAPPAEARPATAGMASQAASPAESAEALSPTTAVITIDGVCPSQPRATSAKGATTKNAAAQASTSKTTSADCKTVITKAEFEELANALAPPNPNSPVKTVNPQVKRQLANVLPRFIAMSDEAKKRGMDKTPQYKEVVKFAQMQILTNQLQRQIQADAAEIPDSDVEAYYKQHSDAFEQYTLERLFVPRNRQVDPEAAEKQEGKDKLTDEQQKERQEAEKAKLEEGEQSMTKLAEDLRTRAAAGEDFTKLQKEAFEAAGMKIESPTVTLPKVRRSGLPATHAAVFDLKAGEVSQVINDSGGHYIYKLTAKDELSFDQAKEEIHNKLQSDRTRELMEKVNSSFKVDTNEAYFGPGAPGMPGPRGPAGMIGNPRPTAASAAKPQAQPQSPPAASEPASTPATKPN